MEFLKKYWIIISLATLAIAGVVLAMVFGKGKEDAKRKAKDQLPPERSEDTKGPGRMAPVTGDPNAVNVTDWMTLMSMSGQYCTPEAANQADTLLKRGVTGASEAVKCLQSAIGADVDGVFGPQTETKLKAKTGKTQTTLKDYFTTNLTIER